jgi:hypothetical protein
MLGQATTFFPMSFELKSSVAEPHHFYAAPALAPIENFDAAPDPTLLYTIGKL